MLVLRTARPIAAFKLGEDSSGRTAGRGSEGAGEADLLTDGEDPKDDRLLVAMTGGSIGRGVVIGVPGFDGAGEAMVKPPTLALDSLCFTSVGAGLAAEILLPGRSILLNLP